MGKRVSARATRGGEGRNTAVSGHRIHVVRLGKPLGPVRTRQACFPGACGPAGRAVRRLGDSAPRWPAGSLAQWGRGPGCGFASDHAAPTPNPAGGGFVCIRQREIRDLRHVNSAERKSLPKKRIFAAGVGRKKRDLLPGFGGFHRPTSSAAAPPGSFRKGSFHERKRTSPGSHAKCHTPIEERSARRNGAIARLACAAFPVRHGWAPKSYTLLATDVDTSLDTDARQCAS